MSKVKTVHTSRTMMYAELEKVMASSQGTDGYLESLKRNVTGKKSNSGVAKTAKYLQQLYGFDAQSQQFAAFKYFWGIADAHEKPLITLVFAVSRDDLLAGSVEIMRSVPVGERVSSEAFLEEIQRKYLNHFSASTFKSLARNIASSWKQGGFLVGKVKSIRSQPNVTFRVACFALLLAYLNGDRGDFIWNSKSVSALCLSETKLRDLAIECSRRDFMQYHYAGSVTSISFTSLLNKIGIHGDKN